MRANDLTELAEVIDEARVLLDGIIALAEGKRPSPHAIAAIARAATTELETASARIEHLNA